MVPGGHELWRDTAQPNTLTHPKLHRPRERARHTLTHTWRMGARDPEGGEPLNVTAALSSSVAQHTVSHTPVWVLLFILVLLFVWLG